MSLQAAPASLPTMMESLSLGDIGDAEEQEDLTDIPLGSPPCSHGTDNTWEIIDARVDVLNTPSSGSEDAPHHAPETNDNEAYSAEEVAPRRKPGGYESRIEQILYENPDLPILITDAGKSAESGGRYIVYTIRTGVCWAFNPPPSTFSCC